MRLCVACLLLVGAAADAAQVTYAVAIGNNAPPQRDGAELPVLRFADDDAVRYHELFARMTEHHWLLSVLDAATLRRYPGAAEGARPPSLQALRGLIKEIAGAMRADLARGDAPVLYLSYSGHGAQREDGVGYLAMIDGELTRSVLYEEVFAALPAVTIHVFIDACHAEAVVGSRGLFSRERDAPTATLSEAESESVVAGAGLRRFPQVGVLMATTESQESHEWTELQSGIFTHELLSGLSGAADVNGDGVVEYSEAQAFITSANRDVSDPRALPRVVSMPPAVNPHAPLIRLNRLRAVAFLDDTLAQLGHFHIELDNGERYLDANLSAEGPVRIAIPAARTAYLVTAQREAELSGDEAQTRRLSDLRFRDRSTAARGSLESSFRTALFQSPFGRTYYEGFADSAGGVRVAFAPRVELKAAALGPRRTFALGAFGVGAASAVAAGVLGILAGQARYDFERTTFQRAAFDARSRYEQFGVAAIVCAATAAAFGIGGWLLWPQADAKGAGVTLRGDF